MLDVDIFANLVDDDPDSNELVERLLKQHGIKVRIFVDPVKFLSSPGIKRVCIVDYLFSGSPLTGLEVIEPLISQNENCRIILITGVITSPTMILKLVNTGAFKFLIKGDDHFNNDLVKYTKQAIRLANIDIQTEKFIQSIGIRNTDDTAADTQDGTKSGNAGSTD